MGKESASTRILFIEDLKEDVERAVHRLRRDGLECEWRRVETELELRRQLQEFHPDLILSDSSLPEFDGMSALRIARTEAPHIPFLFLSGTIGEERAIHALHAGAVDYVLKENLARLAPAIQRALGEAETRREHARQEAQIARLNRVLRMLSGINGLVLRIRERNELLRETCRLAVVEGGYAAAIAAAEVPGAASIQPVAWSGLDPDVTEQLSDRVAASAASESGLVVRVVASGQEVVHEEPEGDAAASGAADGLLAGSGLRTLVVLPLRVDGTTIAVLVLAARDTDVVGQEELAMLREVAGNLSLGLQYLQRDTRARFLSHFDPQTGLAKRPLFCERVQRLVSMPVSPRTRHAVAVMDIERLSVINDSFGRRIGDLLLQHVADRLRQAFPGGQVAHFGGGTFALVRTQGARTDEQVRASARRQADRIFGEPFVIEGHEIPVRARGGFALWPEDGEDPMTLVQNAEAALQYARESGEVLVRYSPASRSNRVGQLALEHRLRFALERGEFELHYQPKVSMASRRIQGAEALLRWRRDQELVSPALFLPSLEASGLIVKVGQWVIKQAARDCQEWMNAGLPPVRIAVNISPLQLREPDFCQHFLDAVTPWATPDWGLDVEITEGVLQEDSPQQVEALHRLREAGSRIGIDDFGTGYSSLARLATLPVNTLKIDRSFVSRCTDGGSGGSLVRTIIALARALQMLTVAEGVEKPGEFELLQQLGCDKSQGFLHSPPVTAAEFTRMLVEGRGPFVRPAALAPRPRQRARG